MQNEKHCIFWGDQCIKEFGPPPLAAQLEGISTLVAPKSSFPKFPSSSPLQGISTAVIRAGYVLEHLHKKRKS